MLPHYGPKKTTMATTRRWIYRNLYFRHTLLLIIALSTCAVMIHTFQQIRSRTLVIKLHNSEERFVEEALHEILLVPDKLAISPEKSLLAKCAKLNKDKCNCATKGKYQSKSHGAGHDEERAGNHGKHASGLKGKDLGHFDLPIKEIWSARRREWKDNEEIQRMKGLLTSNALYRRNIDIMNLKMPPLLPNFKNPCFLANPREMTQCRGGAFKSWERFATKYNQGAVLDQWKRRLSCLPYFIITGMPKCGASELLYALSHHQDVTYPLPFQSKWLSNARFEESCDSVEAYMDFFDSTAQQINKSANEQGVRNMISGEVAEGLIWDNRLWPTLPGNEGQMEPRFTNADYLFHLDPTVRVILILRDPVDRLYEEYNEDALRLDLDASADDFHSRVVFNLDVVRACLMSQPIRSCVYDGIQETPDKLVQLRSGMYVTMLRDWLRVFPRDQVHVISYETFHKRMRIELIKVVKFLGLKDVRLAQIDAMMGRAAPKGKGKPAKKKEKKKEIEKEGEEKGEQKHEERQEEKKEERKEEAEHGEREREDMLEETKEMLKTFYRPLNKQLAVLLEDEAFLWD